MTAGQLPLDPTARPNNACTVTAMSGDPDETAPCMKRVVLQVPQEVRGVLWRAVLESRADLWAPLSKAPDIARRLILDGMLPEKAIEAADLLSQ